MKGKNIRECKSIYQLTKKYHNKTNGLTTACNGLLRGVGVGLGAGGEELKLVLRIPTLALRFHSGKNIYLFGPCGSLLTRP